MRIETGIHEIVIEVGERDPERPSVFMGGKLVASELHDPNEGTTVRPALDAIEAVMLAHAVAGIDITSPAYMEGIETVIDKIGNEYF